MYTKKNVRVDTIYLRCKHKNSENCHASVICRENFFEKAILSIPHLHDAHEGDFDKVKFSMKLEQLCIESPFNTPLELYTKAKEALAGQINMRYISELKNYFVFIHRKQDLNVPLKATTIEHFEELINNPKYQKSYMFDTRQKLFYRGVWRNSAGSNVVFISSSVLEKINTLKSVLLLMDLRYEYSLATANNLV